MDSSTFVTILSDAPAYGQVRLSRMCPVAFLRGVNAVVGPIGSGKTTLGLVLEKGRYAYGNRLRFADEKVKAKMLAFSDIHTFTGVDVRYFEQRMESTTNDLVPTVGEILGAEAVESPLFRQLSSRFHLPTGIADKRVNYLSSGELRKLLLINALFAEPDLLVLDNPYIGLDAPSAREFDTALQALGERGMCVVLLLSENADIPEFAASVTQMEECRITSHTTSREEIARIRAAAPQCAASAADLPHIIYKEYGYDVAFSIRDGHLRYGDIRVMEGFDWTVRRGERWALTGPNGSGKSLLLSIVCGDNPQAYANHVTLFDRPRGSGESIWEIKDRIGFVSSEQQLYFKSAKPVVQIVAQGLHPSLGMNIPVTETEEAEAMRWLEMLGIERVAQRQFRELSDGEKRLTLMARAMIKQPQLLVLDEPFHGIDSATKATLRRVIDHLMEGTESSLIFVTHRPEEVPACVTLHKSISPHKNS